MWRKGIAVAILLLYASHYAAALDNAGQKAGNLAGDYANDKYHTKSDIETKVKMPMTDATTPLSTLDATKSGSGTTFCGQGDVKGQALAIEVTLEETTITVATDTNADGIIDNSQTQQIDKICTNGVYASGTYYQWEVSPSGYVSASLSGALSGCVSPASAPPSYAGGRISELYAAKTGRTIMGSTQKGTKISYYSGQVTDCNNQPQDLSATKYYDNPYEMENDGASAAGACLSSTDPACKAYQGLKGANDSISGGSGDVTCTVTRIAPTSAGPENGKVCEANKIYYPSGYSETNKWCQPQTRWDYCSAIRLRCNPYGTALKAEGWASWEGAPCGTKTNFPPEDQMSRDLSFDTVPNTLVGSFSVNYRMDGPNTSPSDLSADTRCYSEVLPLSVHMSSTCQPDKSQCDWLFTIDNAPACSSFSVSVSPPVGDNVDDGCALYASGSGSYDCHLKEERWADATGQWTQVISGGSPTHNETPETCKTFGAAGLVCKSWWTKERTYNCESTKGADPDISRASSVTDSATLSGTSITYTSPECSVPGADCQVNVWDQTAVAGDSCEMSCLVKRAAGAAKKGTSTYDYYAQTCEKKTSGTTTTYECPLQTGDTLVKDCGCIDTSGQAIGVLGAVSEAAKDRQCKN